MMSKPVLTALVSCLVVALFAGEARGQLQLYRSRDSQRLYIYNNSPRTAIGITLLIESNLTYPVESGWIKINNSRLDVFEVGGIVPERGLVPSGPGFSGQAIDARAAGVYYWAGTNSQSQDLRVIRRRLIVSMSNACGVATFTRPLTNFDFNGTILDFNQLLILQGRGYANEPIPTYCK
jgi:hypothetical protein